MQVTHQTTIDVRKGDHLAACDNCGRFLYPEEMELG
jgi:predicted  nucleic acid-binding Zn-ribbon protein